MSSTMKNDAEDVNDFLKRIQELGSKRDQEDEERNRRLEEEILQGRKERQARRAERARSISPPKDSPATTPPTHGYIRGEGTVRSSRVTLSPAPDLPPSQLFTRDKFIGDAMERLTGEFSPTKENTTSIIDSGRGSSEVVGQGTSSIKASPASTISNSRNSPLSWQRRPDSQSSDRPRSRPLSMVATENAARSPRATPEPSPSNDEQTPISRDQISRLLGSKDPAWFRQTADRGEGSPAYRKNQVEDDNVVDFVSSRIQLPGITNELDRQLGDANNTSSDLSSSSSQTGNNSSSGSFGRSSYTNTVTMSRSIGSPLPLTSAQRLQPPKSDTTSHKSDDTSEIARGLAMSPSQGRISPERLERPVSPTKGMGGFVQSAMMKRSDSVSKRWSVQSPQGLSRGNSTASNRGIHDVVVNVGSDVALSAQTREPRPGRDNSPLPPSRPTSSHSNATVVQDGERPGTSCSLRSSMTTSTTDDGFVKPSLPVFRPQTINEKDGGNDISGDTSQNTGTTPPSSPSKATDNRRWSPTKSSWLESALNKPDSSKPKTSLPLQQPSWMSEINKVKQQKANVESARSSSVHKHEVNIGGLLRSPPPSGFTKPLSIGVLPAVLSSGSATRVRSDTEKSSETAGKVSSITSPEALQQSARSKSDSSKTTPATPTGPVASNSASSSPVGAKVKPDAPPKLDFRSNLKPRQVPAGNESKQEPEFKNLFGQLRRTKTQNYVAPDELKDNILRSKAALNMTGGPKKTERKDEFKEAILKKKEDFRKAQVEGTGVTRSSSSGDQKTNPLPEALAKKAALGKSSISAASEPAVLRGQLPSPADLASRNQFTSELPKLSSSKESTTLGRIPSRETGEKLADRFNPALVSLLARGPPLATSDPTRSSNPVLSRTENMVVATSNIDSQESGPQLTHMTKGRARGPRRKAPTAQKTLHQTLDTTEAKEQDKIPAVSPGLARQVDVVLLSSGPNTGTTPAKSPSKAENEGIQASSPHKLDPKRRSLFLEKVPDKNEKTLQQLEFPTPLSTTKNANASELLVTKPRAESTASIAKIIPTAKLNPFSLTKPSEPENRVGAVLESTPSKLSYFNDSRSSQWSSLISRKSPEPTQDTASESANDKKLPTPRLEANVPAAVKDSITLLNRKATLEFTEKQAFAKEPIKLPTQKDEDAALVSAGLRSPGAYGQVEISGTPVSMARKDSPIYLKNISATATTPTSTRPLPTPYASIASLPTRLITPATPRKLTVQSVPQSSEASRLVTDFFGKNDFVQDFDIDTASVISSKAEQPAKIKTLRSQLFQISGEGKKQQVPSHQERLLFQSNMYICPHTYGTLAGKKIIEVYFWAGDDVPESNIDDAELFAQREARNAGGKLVKMRQGKETSQFIEALGGIMITRRGSSNKYDSLAPHILCGRRYAGQIVFDEVDFSFLSLCSGFPYLISTQSGKCYLWKGKGSDIDELSCARLIGMDFGITGEIEEIEDGCEPVSFLKVFGDEAGVLKSADHWRLKPSYQKYNARLFRADKSKIIEIAPFSQFDISPSSIYVLDAFFEIYIIVGAHSQTQYPAFCTALLFAQEYGILAAGMEDRPFVPVSTVVLEGVPRDLKFVFRKWRDALAPTVMHSPAIALARGRSLRVVPLSAALDATRF